MTDPQLGLTMLVLFIGAITLGFPIAFTLMALGLGFGYMGMGDAIFSLFVQRTYAVMSNDVLISIPLFVFMGYLVERANILDRLFRSIQMTFGRMTSKLKVSAPAVGARSSRSTSARAAFMAITSASRALRG